MGSQPTRSGDSLWAGSGPAYSLWAGSGPAYSLWAGSGPASTRRSISAGSGAASTRRRSTAIRSGQPTTRRSRFTERACRCTSYPARRCGTGCTARGLPCSRRRGASDRTSSRSAPAALAGARLRGCDAVGTRAWGPPGRRASRGRFSEADLEDEFLLDLAPSGVRWTSARADLLRSLRNGARVFHIWFGIGTFVEVRLACARARACVGVRARACACAYACHVRCSDAGL